MPATLDVQALETKVKDMYRLVAQEPQGNFHFEVGRGLALRLGYDATQLSAVPSQAVDSFAGVGHFFDLADLQPGERVVDLGSGPGMDAFYAAGRVGATGRVTGIDFTAEQLAKARHLAERSGTTQVEFREGRIEQLPLLDAEADCVVSNGVINLCPDKPAVRSQEHLAPGHQALTQKEIPMKPTTLTRHRSSRSRLTALDRNARRFAYRSATDDGNPSYAKPESTDRLRLGVVF